MRKFLYLALALIPMVFMQCTCSKAKSNQIVLVSSNCGTDWKQISAGESVPKGTMNPCYMRVVIPNYNMQGQTQFISNFADKVKATVHIDYDYKIIDGLAFMKKAKRLGNTNADVDAALNDAAFESAENTVIEVNIKEVSKGINPTQDIVDVDQLVLEETLKNKANEILKPLGVELNFITLTFDLGEQTQQAIDVATAMRIYQAKGLEQLGGQIIAARAGATKVIVENKTTQSQPAE